MARLIKPCWKIKVDKEKQLDDFFGLNTDPDKNQRDGIKESYLKRLSKKSRFKLIPKILSRNERYAIIALVLLLIGGILSIPFTVFFHYTQPVADRGGSFIEGLVGEPHHINPLLSQANDVDRDLVSLVYSGLLTYSEDGTLVPDLAKSYEISSDGLNYTVYMREDALWHDGKLVTADDIVFTIQTAKNADYGSLQRINWTGVDVEKIDTYAVMFKLKNKYAQFLNNLTLKILPKHIWQDVKPINFAFSDFNTRPLGSGPYKFSKLQKDNNGKIFLYEFKAFDQYYGGRPNINTISIKLYDSEDEMITAYNQNEIDNLGIISANKLGDIRFKQRLDIQQLKMPRYFALFYNQNQSSALADKNIRLALAHATDREKIVQELFDGYATLVDSPMVNNVLDFGEDIKKYQYDPELAKDILEKSGWGNPDENGILTKGNQKLSFKLTTSVWPELTGVASFIENEWKKIGVEVVTEILNTPELQQSIKDRNYQILLFGEILNVDPDPFTFWHSSGKRDPGLNLALYENKTADVILEEARQTLNPIERKKLYNDFQKIVVEDTPAMFLYSTYYLYGLSNDIKGYDNRVIAVPSGRFSNIQNWYINTKRVGKEQ